MDLKHKLKDLVMSEFAYDLSKYENEGEAKVNNVTENLVKLFSLYIVSHRRELLLDYTKQLKKQGTLKSGQDESKLVKKYLSNNCG
jgi:hypothetical protein